MSKDITQDAVSLRRYLHAHPEISCEEEQISAYLKKLLQDTCSFDDLIEFEHYGIGVLFKGKSEGKRILVRGDFDALPIQEVNDFEYKSIYDGKSHKCGHDGHASILYTLARRFSINRPEKGDVVLIFQPAEENGEGAKGIINDPKFESIKPDYAVALHNLPGYAKHAIVVKEGAFTAAANSIIIKLEGKTSHAAEPELGINPAEAMAEITQEILAANQPDLSKNDFHIATPVYTTMGEKAYGVSAGYGELHFTLRAWDNHLMEAFEKECQRIAEKIANQFDLKVDISWTQEFFSNQNDKRVVEAIKATAQEESFQLITRDTPFKWGEDFGLFTEKYAGAMFGVGAGEDSPALHNPDYDFPDEIIDTAASMFVGIISKLQN